MRNPINCLPNTEAILRLLHDPETYDEKPQRVECVETNISWVFLTDNFAYKLRKPVRFGFLDFSELQLRREACEEEVRLNQRLAPHIYLGVVPITTRFGKPCLGGIGTPVEWIVKMQRLPADRVLDELIRTGKVTDNEVRRIGCTLSKFYDQLPPLAMRTDEYRHGIEHHVRENRNELLDPRHGLDRDTVLRVHEAQLRLLSLVPEMLDNRVLDGRVIEGHGDLRPEHIYLVPFPTIIDCIEFNAEFRKIDVLDELAFLAMECALLDADWIGADILKEYRHATGDAPPIELLSFYKSYRACVRAKVFSLRAEQVTGPQRQNFQHIARQYLRLADVCCQPLGPSMLIVVRGVTGTGKSTLAAKLAESLGIEHLQTDAVHRELYGEKQLSAGYGEGIYVPQSRARVYEELMNRSAMLLAEGRSVILDGTFLTAASRADAVAFAHSKYAVPLIVHCYCRDRIARQRIKTAKTLTESRVDIHLVQKREEEPDPEGLPVYRVNTANSLRANVANIVKQLGAAWASSRQCSQK